MCMHDNFLISKPDKCKKPVLPGRVCVYFWSAARTITAGMIARPLQNKMTDTRLNNMLAPDKLPD